MTDDELDELDSQAKYYSEWGDELATNDMADAVVALVAEVRRLKAPQEATWNGVRATWDNGTFTIGDEPLRLVTRVKRRRWMRDEYWNEAEHRWQLEPVENGP